MPLPRTLFETREALFRGHVSAGEVIESTLRAIEERDRTVHAFLEVFADSAREQAKQLDENGACRDEKKLLAGIPIAVKDVICTTVGHTTAASKMLSSLRSPYEATVIKKLKAAGAIIIGKTNLDEFAMGSSNEYSAIAPVKNPWDERRVAGGSSGGSAAAVAAAILPAALGTETGGSIRLPASFCGVVGLKTTYGRVSRFGVIAYGSSLDQVGPLTRTVKDAALLLEVLAGHDSYDATSAPHPVPRYSQECGKDIEGLTVGVPKEYFAEGIDPAVAECVRAAIDQLKSLGASVKQVSLPLTPLAIAVYYLIAKAEASTNLARYDGLRFSPFEVESQDLFEQYLAIRGSAFGEEVKRAIIMGTYALSAGYADQWYKTASKVRTLIRREYESVFKTVDVLAAPVSPEVAFPLSSKANNPLAMYLSDALTVSFNVAGVPAVSVPCGFVNPDGVRLPVGLQLSAAHFKEDVLLRVAAAYEALHEWWKQTPAIGVS